MRRTLATGLVVFMVGAAGCGDREDRAPAAARPAPATAPETATDSAPEAEARPRPADDEPPLPLPAPDDGEPARWADCGRIRAPRDGRPQRVEAITFDCRAARRVASRYLKDRSLPHGWGPADCAASRASCEQGGWGFRVVEE